MRSVIFVRNMSLNDYVYFVIIKGDSNEVVKLRDRSYFDE